MLRLPQQQNDDTLVAKLAAAGVEVQALSSHYGGRNRQPGLLLSFAGFTEKELLQAVGKLVAVLQQQLRSQHA